MKPSVLQLFSTPIVTFKIEEDTQELNKINNYTQSVISNYDNNKSHFIWLYLFKII